MKLNIISYFCAGTCNTVGNLDSVCLQKSSRIPWLTSKNADKIIMKTYVLEIIQTFQKNQNYTLIIMVPASGIVR